MPPSGDGPQQYGGYPSMPPQSFFHKLRHWLYFRRSGAPAAVWAPEYMAMGSDRSSPARQAHAASFSSYPSNPVVMPGEQQNPRLYRSSTQPGEAPNQYPYWRSAPPWETDRRYTHQRPPDTNFPPAVHSSYPSQGRRFTEPPNPTGHEQQIRCTAVPKHFSNPSPGRNQNRDSGAQQPNPNARTRASPSPQRRQPEREASAERRPNHPADRRPRPLSGGVPRHNPPPPRGHDASPSRASYALLPELIPTVLCYPSIDWNICFPVSSAFKWVGPGSRGPINLATWATMPPVKELDIVSRKDTDALCLALARFGPIRAVSENKKFLTVRNILDAIKDYFDTPVAAAEMDALDPTLRNYVSKSYCRRWESQGKEVKGEVWPTLSHRGPARVDFLLYSFQYAGLEMDEDFAENQTLHLTLQNRWLLRF